MRTTFQKIKNNHPCKDGWDKLIRYYQPENLDKTITITEIIKSNGIQDAIWALKCVEDKRKVLLFSADVAESVLPIFKENYPNDSKIEDCINATRDFANNKITLEELKIFKTDAAAAANAAANAANAYAAANAANAYAAADAAAYAANAAANAAADADADAYAAADAANAAAYAAYADAYADAYAADAAYADAYADAYAANAYAARNTKWEEITKILLTYL